MVFLRKTINFAEPRNSIFDITHQLYSIQMKGSNKPFHRKNIYKMKYPKASGWVGLSQTRGCAGGEF